jgi:hypothetical protein
MHICCELTQSWGELGPGNPVTSPDCAPFAGLLCAASKHVVASWVLGNTHHSK